jgi:hypothetical protein
VADQEGVHLSQVLTESLALVVPVAGVPLPTEQAVRLGRAILVGAVALEVELLGLLAVMVEAELL